MMEQKEEERGAFELRVKAQTYEALEKEFWKAD